MDLRERLGPLADRLSLHREALSLGIDIAIHPNSSGKIMIIYPGWGSSIDGTGGKYKRLAPYVQNSGLAAVIRLPPPGCTLATNLLKGIRYSLAKSEEICGSPTPEIFLMGSSAGAGAVAATAYRFKEVKRILLTAPSTNIGIISITHGLLRFRGEVYIVIGSADEVVGVESGYHFSRLAIGATHKELKVIPGCDHTFSGERGGRILSQAPFWAFSEGREAKFPDENRGINLYQ